MQEAALSPFAAWENFYVIIGSSAAALIGLQFVVIALVAESRTQSTPREIAAFGTPTILHFSAVLLVAAILSAPWHGLSKADFALGACGAAGVGYVLVVLQRTRQTNYTPVLEDWLWHVVFPFLAYGALLVAAIALRRDPAAALFAVGASALMLLFTGIHNSWDTVTYIAVEQKKARRSGEGEKGEGRPKEG
ncbi:MAG: hypothetical protein QOJ16_4137 [Acidobacteriota bacterium]|nr:hypothetical protein [Acidobacteriota bacterium]